MNIGDPGEVDELLREERSGMSINQVSEKCKGVCTDCEVSKACRDLKKDHSEAETITLTVTEYQELVKDEDFWHREAIRLAAELGEMKIGLAKFIDENLQGGSV